jgi:hypothetical protein
MSICDRNYKSGFTLIMVSILLTVAALIFVSVLPGKEAGDVNQKMINNTKKLERVEEAMRSFMAFKGRRPCPAQGSYAVTSQYFGMEAANPGTCTGGTPAAPLGPDSGGAGNIVGGTIPTRTLGLPADYAFDDYGRRFTYIVDIRATKASTCSTLEGLSLTNSTPTGKGGLYVANTNGGTPIDQTMYAYISHGASGYGAFPAQGSTAAGRINSGSTDVDMQVNAGVDHPGVGGTFTYSTTNFTNTKIQKDRIAATIPSGGTDTGFDDMVWYRPDLKNTCCLGAVCIPIGFVADGTAQYADVGGRIAVGDVTGDNTPDIVTTGSCAYVVQGVSGGGYADPLYLTPNVASSPNIFKFCPPDYQTAAAVAVGDVNGDGIKDIIIGTYNSDSAAGRVYVVFGKSSWSQTSYTLDAVAATHGVIDGVQGFEIKGAAVNDVLGYALAAGNVHGSVNGGHAIADVIMGASTNYCAGCYGGQNLGLGKVYVLFGNGTTGLPSPTVNTHATSCVDNVSSTSGLAVGETVSGSGFAANTTITAIGTCNGVNSVTLSSATSTTVTGTNMYIVIAAISALADGTNGVELDAVTVAGEAGYALATGDINHDGKADIIANSGNGVSTYIIFGGSGGWVSPRSLADLNGSAGTGGANGTFGFRVDVTSGAGGSVAAGDVNGDGTDDIIIGAPYTGGATGSGSGEVFVVFGSSDVWPASFNASALNGSAGTGGANGTFGFRLDGPWASAGAGWVAAGDINGDGIADILIYDGYNAGGLAQVVFGGTGPQSGGSWPATAPLTAAWLGNGGSSTVNGFTLTSLNALGGTQAVAIGDITGDGKGEVMVGLANGTAANGTTFTGAIYVLYGKSLSKWALTYDMSGL